MSPDSVCPTLNNLFPQFFWNHCNSPVMASFPAKLPSVTSHHLLNQLRIFNLADTVLQKLARGSLTTSSPAALGLGSSSPDRSVIRLPVPSLPLMVPLTSMMPPLSYLHEFTSSCPYFKIQLGQPLLQEAALACPLPPPILDGILQYCLDNPVGSAFPTGLWVPGRGKGAEAGSVFL